MWEDKAYPSLKPYLNWVEDLMQRLGFVHEWIDGGIPPVFWVSGFYFPQGFLTAILQNYARKYKFPIDMIDFNFKVPPGEGLHRFYCKIEMCNLLVLHKQLPCFVQV